MELQNIAINFTSDKVSSFYTDLIYDIGGIDLSSINSDADTDAGFDVVNMVVQYTEDQHGVGAVPRVILNDDAEQQVIIPISELSTELSAEIVTLKGLVETEITNQLG